MKISIKRATSGKLDQEKKERKCIYKIFLGVKRNVTTNNRGHTIISSYAQLYTNKVESLDEMDDFRKNQLYKCIQK